jgi:hypothetical protein
MHIRNDLRDAADRGRRTARNRGVGGTLLVALLFWAGGASAQPDSCRDWRNEHRQWKIETLRRSLHGAPQADIDAAVFELLQREAYLTSCETSLEGGRDDLIGWRLVGRLSDEYGTAVMESVLERAGFTLDLRVVFMPDPPRFAASPARNARRSHRSVRPR